MTAACTNCGQNSPYELIQALGGAMVCHTCHVLAKTAAEVLETGRTAHLRSIDGGGLGVCAGSIPLFLVRATVAIAEANSPRKNCVRQKTATICAKPAKL